MHKQELNLKYKIKKYKIVQYIIIIKVISIKITINQTSNKLNISKIVIKIRFKIVTMKIVNQ